MLHPHPNPECLNCEEDNGCYECWILSLSDKEYNNLINHREVTHVTYQPK